MHLTKNQCTDKKSAKTRRQLSAPCAERTNMAKNNLNIIYDGQHHIVLFGKKGSGKTTLFRHLISDNMKTVHSTVHGATVGICNLGKVGPVVLIDTADLNGAAELDLPAEERVDRTTRMHDIIRRADVAMYVTDVQEFDRAAYLKDKAWLERNMVPHLLVFNRCDDSYAVDIARYKTEYPEAVFLSATTPEAISLLRMRLAQMVLNIEINETPLIPKNFVKAGDYAVILTHATGSTPPAFRANLIPELLERGVHCVVTPEDTLDKLMEELPHVDLVVAFARSFKKLKNLPENIRLTSYSMLYGKQCNLLETFAEGARAVHKLNGDSRVLVVSSSDFMHANSDTGRIRIPRELRRAAGESLRVDYLSGGDLPMDLEKYDLVVHYLDSSLTQRAVQARAAMCKEAGVPVATYGTVLAELNGMLDRCVKALQDGE